MTGPKSGAFVDTSGTAPSTVDPPAGTGTPPAGGFASEVATWPVEGGTVDLVLPTPVISFNVVVGAVCTFDLVLPTPVISLQASADAFVATFALELPTPVISMTVGGTALTSFDATALTSFDGSVLFSVK